MMEKHLILGAAGFLGNHLEHRLRSEGHYVVSVARKHPSYRKSVANEFNFLDLTNVAEFHTHFLRHRFDYVWQLAGEVGGLGYIGTGAHDADILTNSLKINLYTLEAMVKHGFKGRVLFTSSQCVYPDVFEIDPFAGERLGAVVPRKLKEADARFDHNFAFAQEKLYAEQLYQAYGHQYDMRIRIARLGNTYGPYCDWKEPRCKAIAAICRKVAQAPYAGVVELWGDGQQSRSFTYVDDAIEGMIRLMHSDYYKPINISSEETVTIEELFELICKAAGKIVAWKGTVGPLGVTSRTGDASLAREMLDWEPRIPLYDGIAKTYAWIASQCLTKQSA